MAIGGSRDPAPRNDLCRRCGTPIDFLSSCPSCGTVAGIDPSLSDGELAGPPKLTLVAPPEGHDVEPPAPSSGGGWGAPSKSALPAELLRAWDVTATTRTKPVVAKRWRRAFALLLVLAIAGGVTGAVLSSRSNRGPAAPPAVRAYSAPGAPFQAGFPAQPIESHAAMTLDGMAYVATAYTAFSNRQMFSATVYPFPLGLPTMSAQQFLRIFTSKLAAQEQLAIPGTTPTTYRGLPALAAVLTSPSGTTYTKLLAVLDGHVGYVLMVSGSSPLPSGYQSFVSSFRLAG